MHSSLLVPRQDTNRAPSAPGYRESIPAACHRVDAIYSKEKTKQIFVLKIDVNAIAWNK